jgi:iron complex transport system substrate-binding protein
VKRRVVALTCSNTEIVCALGCAEMLVAVDDHSDFPAEVVRTLPRVGPDLSVDVDRIASHGPDLVLASLSVPGHERVIENLSRKRLPFVALEPRSLTDVYANILEVARLLDVPERGRALVFNMQAELAPLATAGPKPRLLLEWWPKPVIVPGRDSWVNQLFDAAGAENPLAERPVKSTPLTDEDAAALLPDASIISWCGVRVEKYRPDVVLRRAAWQHLELVKQRRVFPITEAWLGRPGPRLVEGARALREVVRALSQPVR